MSESDHYYEHDTEGLCLAFHMTPGPQLDTLDSRLQAIGFIHAEEADHSQFTDDAINLKAILSVNREDASEDILEDSSAGIQVPDMSTLAQVERGRPGKMHRR